MTSKLFYSTESGTFNMLLSVNIEGSAYFTQLNTDNLEGDTTKVSVKPFEELGNPLFAQSKALEYINNELSLINEKIAAGESAEEVLQRKEKLENDLKEIDFLKTKFPDNRFFAN